MPSISINLANTTFVSSSLPNSNMNFYPTMYVGTDPSYLSCNGLLQFTLPSLPVTSVDSAVMQFTLLGKNQATPSVVTVNMATSPFSTSVVTYNTQPTFAPTTSHVTVNQSDLYQRVSVDITQLVNSWLAGTYVNQGIVLTCPGDAVQLATNNIVYAPYFPTLTLTYSSTPPIGSSAYCFIYTQLANILKQLIALYPAKTMTIYLAGGYYVQGTPYAFDNVNGMIVELTETGGYASVPLVNICAVKVAGTTFDPSIKFLTPPVFTSDCSSKLVNSIHDNFPVSTSVTLDLNTLVTVAGLIYRNEYGMLVIASNTSPGASPVFVPVWTISAFETTVPIPLPTTFTAQHMTASADTGKPMVKRLTEQIVI